MLGRGRKEGRARRRVVSHLSHLPSAASRIATELLGHGHHARQQAAVLVGAAGVQAPALVNVVWGACGGGWGEEGIQR